MVGSDVQVIPLSEHVDYWNNLGWQDPFSDAVFSDRQRDYAVSLGQESVYTPEMVVDGVRGFNGANENAARQAIFERRRTRKERLSVSAKRVKDSIEVRVSRSSRTAPGTNQNLIVCLTQDNLSVLVRSGENRGRRLSHQAVVRVVRKMKNPGDLTTLSFQLDPSWKLADMHVVSFIQDAVTKEITAAGIGTVSVDNSLD